MQRKSLLVKAGAALSAVVATTTMALVATAAPAAAGNCTTAFCGGRVYNLATSGKSIGVTNCWDGQLGTYSRETLKCAVNGWTTSSYKAHMNVGPRADSVHKYYYDVDGFRVLKGCRVTASWNGGDDKVYDRRGNTVSQWLRMTGTDSVTITSISC
ncbi:hypothetical protein [Actinoplanes sp. NPDC049802]|uniref:hypothetical protein n=1 Tax=Actinoplanes sp. NPDC049802 TaxID=3154742 RepID=UPI0033C989DD